MNGGFPSDVEAMFDRVDARIEMPDGIAEKIKFATRPVSRASV